MPSLIQGQKSYTVAEVAREAEVHRVTLLRWIKAGKVPNGFKDRRGWRLFTPEQLEQIKSFAFLTEPASPTFENQLSLFIQARRTSRTKRG